MRPCRRRDIKKFISHWERCARQFKTKFSPLASRVHPNYEIFFLAYTPGQKKVLNSLQLSFADGLLHRLGVSHLKCMHGSIVSTAARQSKYLTCFMPVRRWKANKVQPAVSQGLSAKFVAHIHSFSLFTTQTTRKFECPWDFFHSKIWFLIMQKKSTWLSIHRSVECLVLVLTPCLTRSANYCQGAEPKNNSITKQTSQARMERWKISSDLQLFT